MAKGTRRKQQDKKNKQKHKKNKRGKGRQNGNSPEVAGTNDASRVEG
jgi:hypothetical protein